MWIGKIDESKKELSIAIPLTSKDFIDQNPELAIERSHPIPKTFNGIEYQWTQVKYPVLIHKFGEYEILTEIIIKEKQYAIGVQPMLYFCFPITELKSKNQLLGRLGAKKMAHNTRFLLRGSSRSVLQNARSVALRPRSHTFFRTHFCCAKHYVFLYSSRRV